MSFGLGFWAAAGGRGPQTFELVSTTVFESNTGAITFDVTSLATEYKHLQIRLTAKHSGSGTSILGRLNGITSNSYAFHFMQGNNTNLTSFGTGSIGYFVIPAMTTSSTTSAFGSGIIDILDPFSATKNKTVRSLAGQMNSAGNTVRLDSGLFVSTSAVTSITLDAGDFVTGSRVSLYGIRG